MTTRAAIVGGAAVTALGEDLASTVEALAQGRRALTRSDPAPAWDGRPPWVARAAPARAGSEGDATLRMLGRHGEWLHRCARAAHAQARGGDLPRERLGLFAGLGMVDSPPEELAPAVLASRTPEGAFDLARFFSTGFRALHPLWPLAMLGNVAAGHVAIALDLRGDNVVLASEGDAGSRAVAEALEAVRAGTVTAALAGGVAEPLSESSLLRRDLRGTLARGPEASAGPGVPAGEGAAVLALEEPRSARARGLPVLGWLSGQGMAFGAPGEPGGAAERAADAALADAGLSFEDLDLVLVDAGLPPGPARLLRGAGGGPGLVGRLARSPRRPLLVGTPGALGHLLGGQAALDVLLSLAAFGAPDTLRHLALAIASDERTAPPPRRAERALVLTSSDAGAAGALVVEAPACAS